MSYEDECPICGAPSASAIPPSVLTGNTFFIRSQWSTEWRKVCGKCADERVRFYYDRII